MKPYRFDFERVACVDDLTALLARHGSEAQILAGGQSLMPMLNMRVARPGLLIDINGVDDFRGMDLAEDHLEIGSLTRHRTLFYDRTVAAAVPMLALAAQHVAHPAVRNRGTIGGSLALADPAAELPAVSVFLGARIRIVSKAAERWCAADDFFVGPMDTRLEEGEAIAAIRFPRAAGDVRFAFQELARRHGDYATVGVAGSIRVAGDAAQDLRLCLFGATGRAVVLKQTSDLLQHEREPTLQAVKEAILQEAEIEDSAVDSAEYRLHLAAVTLRRVAAELKAKASI